MQLSLADVTSRATTLAGGRTEWSVSEVSFFANLAAQEVANQVWHTPYEALAYSSTTSGENRLSLPSDFDTPVSLSNLSTDGASGGRNLTFVTGEWIDSQSSTANGEPECWALYGTWLELWPSPDSSYSLLLRYRGRQGTLVNSTDTPAFDERWHPGWLYKTTELLEASRGNPEGEALARNRYLSYMGSIPDDRARRQQVKSPMAMQYLREDR